jgi:hypothetical protein
MKESIPRFSVVSTMLLNPESTKCFSEKFENKRKVCSVDFFHYLPNVFTMKNTPFQQILKNEMARIESIVYCQNNPIGGQLALIEYKSIKKKGFLLQFLGLSIRLA